MLLIVKRRPSKLHIAGLRQPSVQLFFLLLRYGNVYRSHDGKSFHYDQHAVVPGAWLNKKDRLAGMRPALSLAEGLLYDLST